jgi:glutathione S-transferase
MARTFLLTKFQGKPQPRKEVHDELHDKLKESFKNLDKYLEVGGTPYLNSADMTMADIYAAIFLWMPNDLDQCTYEGYKHIEAYMDRMNENKIVKKYRDQYSSVMKKLLCIIKFVPCMKVITCNFYCNGCGTCPTE